MQAKTSKEALEQKTEAQTRY